MSARGGSLAACVGSAVRGASRQLACAGVIDPAVVLAAGEHCAAELDAFVARYREDAARLRISDSLRIEASRLLESAGDGPGGVNARVIASAGDAAWRQACSFALAALEAGEAHGAIACAVRGKVVGAFAIFERAHAGHWTDDACAVARGRADPPAAPAAAAGIAASLGRTLDFALRTAPADGRCACRGDAHIRIADRAIERPRRRSSR